MDTKNPPKTKAARLEEILKCKNEPAYFIKTYLYIQHPTKGRLPFDLYPFQIDCIADFVKYQNNIILKSRQLGLSTTTAGYSLWDAMFHRDRNIMIMATKLNVGRNMIAKIRTAFQMLPDWMLEMLNITDPEAESVSYIRFNHGSKITAITTSADAGRSEAVSLLIIDECAHILNLDKLWDGLKPTLAAGGKAIMFSSPNGKGGKFHDLWLGAETGEWEDHKIGLHSTSEGSNGFHAIKLMWDVHPDRDEAWFANETKSMDTRQIAQEYLCSFESSGHTYFNQKHIDNIKANSTTPSAYLYGQDLWIWKTATQFHQYVLAADIARGDAEDYSAFHIADVQEHEIVAEYMGKIPTDEFGQMISDVALKYNTALVVIEKNTYGIATGNALRSLKYPNLYYDKDVAEKMKSMDEGEKRRQSPGFTITPKNREGMLTKLESIIRSKQIRIYSNRFANQMETFIFNGKRGEAIKRKNDDLIMAMAILFQIYNPNGTFSHGNEETEALAWHQAFLNGIKKRSNTIESNPWINGTNTNKFLQPKLQPSSQAFPISSYSQNIPQRQQQPQTEMFNGVRLLPGVKKDDVALDQILRSEFDWLF